MLGPIPGPSLPGSKSGLARCDALVLESNHCPEMLRTGPYPEMLKRRIRFESGGTSPILMLQHVRTLSQQIQKVMLSHLSEVNNTPDKAMKTAREGIGLFMDEIRYHPCL